MVVTIVDLVLLLILGGTFLLGFYQGALRGLLGLGAWFVSFVLAANLRTPFGDWLSGYWTQFSADYNEMLAFLILFLLFFVVANVAIQAAYHRTPLTKRYIVVDDVLGGLLGVGVGVLVLATLVIILDTAGSRVSAPGSTRVGYLSAIHDVLLSSAVANTLRESFIPGLLSLLGPLVPDSLAR